MPPAGCDAADACRRMVDAAFACAAAHLPGQRFVMVKADGIELPLRADASLRLPDAHVVFQGRSSITVAVTGGTAKPLISGRFMLLAVGPDGLPVPIQTTTSEESHP